MKQKELFASSNGATFSECRAYRYALWRVWDTSLPLIMFIGLNPSTAMNLFPFVTPYPEYLIECEQIHIEINDLKIKEVSAKCEVIVFAWGNFKVARDRAKIFSEKFPGARCLYKNKNGSPVHPLFVKGDTQLIQF